MSNEDPPGRPAELNIAAYVAHASALLGLPLAEAHQPGVMANLSQLHAIAGPLLAFPLDETVEPAPRFAP